MRFDSPSRLLVALAIVLATALLILALGAAWITAAVVAAGGVAAVVVASSPRRIGIEPVHPPETPSLATVLDAVADPVLVLTSGRVALANAGARALLGGHVVGEDARVAIRHPAAADALAAEEPQDLELVGLGARGRRWRLVAQTAGATRVVTLHDRTGEAAAERMRVDFVANASHELRTPLSAILGYTETLADEAGDDPALRRRFLKIVGDEARRMQRLVDDLISLSRIEADRYRAPDQAIDLGALVADVCAELAAGGSPRAADLRCPPLSSELPAVRGDRAQLSQLLHNIVGNAMKYGRADTPVTLTLDRARGGVRLTVADQGDGIAASHLPRLTERFYRVEAGRSRSLGGTGLGLAIVKHVVERHRGRLDLQSTQGVGTTVTVVLPIADPGEGAVIKG